MFSTRRTFFRYRSTIHNSGSAPPRFATSLQIQRLLTLPTALLLLLSGSPEPRLRGAVPPADPKSPPVHKLTPVSFKTGTRTGFEQIKPDRSGIQFTNLLAESRSITNQVLLNGSGVAAADFDGDGLCDLYFCGLDSPNALYRNLGNWRFEAVQGAAPCQDQSSTGAAFADLDGDGDPDLLVTGLQRGLRIFENIQGRFQEKTDSAGVRGTSGAATLALADLDGDGDLDIYVVNYRNDTLRDMPNPRFRVVSTNGVSQLASFNGQPADSPDLKGRFSFDQSSGVLENGEPDILFINEGGFRFTRSDWNSPRFLDESGKPSAPLHDWGLSAMFRDTNGDGSPDLYVCNDFQSPDRFWLNDGRGGFRPANPSVLSQTSLFSMGVDFADINRDGLDDFIVVDMRSREHERRLVQTLDAGAFAQFRQTSSQLPQSQKNTLFLNRGDGTYAEIARFAGLDSSEWSWSPVFLDVDLDGFEDLLITTGHWRDAMNADAAREVEAAARKNPGDAQASLKARSLFPRLSTPNQAFRNTGKLRFEPAGQLWGFDSTEVSHGMALADLDNDGDLDVVVNCLNQAPLLLANTCDQPRIAVRLHGLPPNTRGIGAQIRIQTGGHPDQTQEMISGGRYLSSDDAVRAFAAFSTSNRLTVEIRWQGGSIDRLIGVAPNQILEITQSSGRTSEPGTNSQNQTVAPMFEDYTARLNHRHEDASPGDFSVQPGLPKSLSSQGPGAAWFDFNNDGFDDLFIGAGTRGKIAVFRNDGRGGFIPQKAPVLSEPSPSDTTGLLAWLPEPASPTLLIASTTDESSNSPNPILRAFSMTAGTLTVADSAPDFSAGPLTLGDYDQDGDPDLFIGNRVIPGQYPRAAASRTLLNRGGKLTPNETNSSTLATTGLVTAAVFSNLNEQPGPELLVAREWGALGIFSFTNGTFREWIPEVRAPGATAVPLSALTGWWNSVATADFDNDGRMDIIAGNWGMNDFPVPDLNSPVGLLFADADGSGHPGMIETWVDPVTRRHLPLRDWETGSRSFPAFRERFTSFAGYARQTVEELLRIDLPEPRMLRATTFETTLLLNRGDHFEKVPLPLETQFAPVFGIAPEDFNGDGNIDLFLAQNFFQVRHAESRQDAGRGLLLLGDGRGGMRSVPTTQSGISMTGEGRAAAISDFDRDGRPDLLVTQHANQTRLYRNNSSGGMGLSLRLTGRASNPQAIGARVRAVKAGRPWGPVREIQSGSGFLSQHSTRLVITNVEGLEAVEFTWPSGTRQRLSVQDSTKPLDLQEPTP